MFFSFFQCSYLIIYFNIIPHNWWFHIWILTWNLQQNNDTLNIAFQTNLTWWANMDTHFPQNCAEWINVGEMTITVNKCNPPIFVFSHRNMKHPSMNESTQLHSCKSNIIKYTYQTFQQPTDD